MRIRFAALPLVGVIALGACGSEPAATADRATAGSLVGPLPVTVAPSSVPGDVPMASVPPEPPGTLDLTDLPVESVPMGLTEYLSSVAYWVGEGVGADVWGGSAFQLPGTTDVTIELYGTDVALVTTALDELDPDERDRFTVVEVDHAVRDLERMAGEAHARLIQADIDGSAWVRFGLDAVAVTIHTADGAPDADLESTVADLLADLPVVIEFGTPPQQQPLNN